MTSPVVRRVPRTVFLDRDGTLNREVGAFGDPARLELLPGVPTALARLAAAGHRLVVVTNQSGIARGLYDERDLARVHERLQVLVGVPLAAILHCPHLPAATGPYGGACACRKPAAGLLHLARELLGIDLDGAVLVGDSARDLLMATALPPPASDGDRVRTVLVRSGKPVGEQREALLAAGRPPDCEAADLPAAADWILGL